MRLIEYLEHARKLENDIYLCDVTVNNLENKISGWKGKRKVRLIMLSIMLNRLQENIYKCQTSRSGKYILIFIIF